MTLPLYPTVRGLTYPVMKSSKESTIMQTGPNGTTTGNPQWQNPMWDFTLIYNYLKDNPYDVLAQYSPATDYATLQGFYLAQQGRAGRFLFDDPTDDTVGPRVWLKRTWYPAGAIIIDPSGHQQTALQNGITGTAAPSWNDSSGVTTDGGQRWQDEGAFPGSTAQELVTVTDGEGNYYSPLQRNFGGQFLEDITDLNTTNIPLTVWEDGVLPTSGYVIEGPGFSIPGYSWMGLVLAWNHQPLTPVTASFQFYFRVRFDSDSADFEQFLYDVWTIGGEDSRNGQGYLKLTSARAPSV